MISQSEATALIRKAMPDGTIKGSIEWEGKWLFAVFTNDPDEGDMDPFYSVDMESGAVAGFSIVGDEDTLGIITAFHENVKHTAMPVGDFLEHYGVKGMKWGVRKDRDSGSSKGSQAAESLLNTAKPLLSLVTPRANVLSTLQQVGAQVAAGEAMKAAMKTTLTSPVFAAGAAVTVLDTGAYRVPGVLAKNALKGGFNKDPSLAKVNMSVADIQKKVIPGVNKDYPGLGTTNNCLRCTYAYEMRRRGFDVAATKTIFASGQTNVGARVVGTTLKGATKIKPSKKVGKVKTFFLGNAPTSSDVMNALAKQPNGSRGDLQMRWGFLGGHSVAYEIIGGKPHVFDTQSGKTYSSAAQLNKLTGAATGLSFNRLDNKNLNQLALPAWVKDRS